MKLPDSLTTIGDGAFADCRMLKTINLPFRLTEVAPSLFANCESLTSVAIPANVTVIQQYAFYRSGLTDITIPEAVTSIGGYAFCGCQSLREVTVPKTVTEIGDMAFGYTVDSQSDEAPKPDPAFVLHGRPASAAKAYAAAAGITFRQHGIDLRILFGVIGAAAAALLIVLMARGQKKHPAGENEQEGDAAAEMIEDPNYTSILDDDADDGDPYDRSYGFSADEDEDDEADSVAEPDSEQDIPTE